MIHGHQVLVPSRHETATVAWAATAVEVTYEAADRPMATAPPCPALGDGPEENEP